MARFCFLTTFYPPYNFGGDGIGIQRFAHGLVRRGHHVTVVHDQDAYRSLSKTPASEVGPEPEGLVRIGLESRLGIVSNLLTQQTGMPVVHGRRIRRILEEGRFDVVNFHNVSLVGGPHLLGFGAGSIRLYMAHEHWLVCPMHVLWRYGRERCDAKDCVRCALTYRRPPQLYRYDGTFERKLAQVDTFIAMSAFSRDKHREFGFPHHMEVVPYFLPDPVDPPPGSDRAGTKPRPRDRPYFLFVGRLEKIKGLDDVIPHFADYDGADLVIAGDGEHRAALESAARGNGRVVFLGRVPLDELAAYYEHAIALIVPSVCFETFGIILIESFRSRTPVIARRLGPFPEIVEASRGGELFSTGPELIAAMRRMQGDPAYRERLAESGYRAFRERWVESAVIPRYLDVVARTAERKGRAGIARELS
jgi:glycosyltransferase involved in cell wall biosynthesis